MDEKQAKILKSKIVRLTGRQARIALLSAVDVERKDKNHLAFTDVLEKGIEIAESFKEGSQ